MSKGQSLQDPFLNALRRERVPVAIYLVNGIKLQGTVESFDQLWCCCVIRSARWSTSTPFPPWYRAAMCVSAMAMTAMTATTAMPMHRLHRTKLTLD